MVQDIGLQLLQRQDNLAAGRETIDRIRVAVLSSGTRSVEDIFPEYFVKDLAIDEDTPDDVLNNPDADYDYSGVKWEVPGDMAEEELRLLEEFLADNTVSGPLAAPNVARENEGWF